MSTSKAPPPDDSLRRIAAEQRRHLVAATAIESDLDLAFYLQLEEAINASLSLHPSTSSSSTPKPKLPLPNDDVLNLAGMQTLELDKFEQELDDRAIIEAETKKMRDDLDRRIHDHRVAREIQSMSDDEWEEQGEYFERPFGEGSSKNVAAEVFRVYFKGLVSEELVGSSSSKASTVAGIGVAICDSRDQLIFELKKPLIGSEMSRRAVEFKALIEGLNAAIALDLKRIVYYCDYYPLYQFVTGRWHVPKQRRIATLVNQVSRLSVNKFTYCRPTLVARNDIKFAFKFAREAIVSQINKPSSSSSSSNQIKNENCVICFEDTDVTHFFSVDVCKHRYCFSCMRQHVEMKLRIGMIPKCPHEGCNSELKIDSCKKFLTPKLIELMGQRLKEASIPPTEKIYCPYPKCSALMTKSEVLEYSRTAFAGAGGHGLRKCLKCHGNFCINCKVPWHNGMTCSEYKRKVPNPNDAKLKSLAERNLWRQCVKCNHMIEFIAGCYHMTCRCGYEFCYTCGAEWKNKKATCACPLWDEENILDDEENILDDDEDDEDEEEYGFGDDDDDESEYYDSDSDDYY